MGLPYKLIKLIVYKQLVIHFFIICLLPSTLKSQQSRTLFFMQDVPQAVYINPAIQPACNYFIGIPALSSVYLNAASTGFNYNNLVAFNAQSFVNGLHSVDFVSGEVHLNLISLGYKHNDLYFLFNVAERVDARLFYPERLLDLAVNGNEGLIGTPLTTNSLGVNATHMREYSFTVSQRVSSEYAWGARGKLLFGKANVTTRPRPLHFSTSPIDYNLYAEWGLQVNSSVPLEIDKLANGNVQNVALGQIDAVNYLLNSRNMGFAADFGFIYAAENITWSASLLDVGAIYWASDARRFNNYGSFQFSGLAPGDILIADAFLQTMEDSLSNQLKVSEAPGSYMSILPVKLNVGATYGFLPKFNLGLLFRTEFFPRRPVPSLTLSINTQNTKWVYSSLTYSVMNGSFQNVGIGLGLRLQSVGIHILSDNILAFAWPQKAHTANFRFGVDVLFGCKNRRDRLPYTGPGCMGVSK